jgi:hypothetical protein
MAGEIITIWRGVPSLSLYYRQLGSLFKFQLCLVKLDPVLWQRMYAACRIMLLLCRKRVTYFQVRYQTNGSALISSQMYTAYLGERHTCFKWKRGFVARYEKNTQRSRPRKHVKS